MEVPEMRLFPQSPPSSTTPPISWDSFDRTEACASLAAHIKSAVDAEPDVRLLFGAHELWVHRETIAREYPFVELFSVEGNADQRPIAPLLQIVAYCYGFHYDGLNTFAKCTACCLSGGPGVQFDTITNSNRLDYAKHLIDAGKLAEDCASAEKLHSGTRFHWRLMDLLEEMVDLFIPESGYPAQFDDFVRYLYSSSWPYDQEEDSISWEYLREKVAECLISKQDQFSEIERHRDDVQSGKIYQREEDKPGYRFARLMEDFPTLADEWMELL
jgi:hypothetical protein